MKKVNVTFSIPEETHNLLRSLVGQRKMSLFVTLILDKALQQEKEVLKKAYLEAANDPDRKETIDAWKQLETEDWE